MKPSGKKKRERNNKRKKQSKQLLIGGKKTNFASFTKHCKNTLVFLIRKKSPRKVSFKIFLHKVEEYEMDLKIAVLFQLTLML